MHVAFVPLKGADPFAQAIGAAPSMNLTEPEGVPEPGVATETEALKVTVSSSTDGLSEELSEVDVFATVTGWLKGNDDDALNLLGSDGVKELVIVYGDLDATNAFVWHCAWPAERITPAHNVTGEPGPDGVATNVAVPMGVAPEAVTDVLYWAV
jgi:hypothetical protein